MQGQAELTQPRRPLKNKEVENEDNDNQIDRHTSENDAVCEVKFSPDLHGAKTSRDRVGGQSFWSLMNMMAGNQ